MSHAKRHHYVPELLLERFAAHGKHLDMRHRDRLCTRIPTSPANAGVEQHFYRIDGETGERALAVEHAFGTIETPATGVLRALGNEQFPLSSADRVTLRNFLAAQFVRGPDIRALVDGVIGVAGELVADIHGADRASETLREFGYPVRAGTTKLEQNGHLGMLAKLIAAVASSLDLMRCVLIRFDGPCLVTSDRPVVVWDPQPPEVQEYGIGLAHRHSLTFHVDSSHCLALVPDAPEVERIITGTPEAACRLNFRAASHAHQWIYHDPELDPDPLAGLHLARNVTVRDVAGDVLEAQRTRVRTALGLELNANGGGSTG